MNKGTQIASHAIRRTLIAAVSSALVLINTSAFAQNPYTICIGAGCDDSASINLDCSFAAAHPSDADEQAAKLVCQVQNKYEKYTYVRTGVVKASSVMNSQAVGAGWRSGRGEVIDFAGNDRDQAGFPAIWDFAFG